jgi:hypothetical protein
LITLTETATSSTPSLDPLNPNPVIVTSPPEITETGARIDLH